MCSVNKVKMENYPYANVVCSLMYAMISIRPDLSLVMSVLSRFMANPGIDHWIAVKWIIAYVAGTLDIDLCYGKKNASHSLVGFVDSNFAGDKDTRKSTTTFYFTFRKNCISWKSGLQTIVTLSTT